MTDIIRSAANPLVKRVRLLADRKHRRREAAFMVQGIQPVWQAVEAGADIEVLIVAPELLRHSGAAAMVAAQEASGVKVARLTAEIFGRIADRDGPSGLAAIVRAAPLSLADLAIGPGSLFAALHEPGNPGNIGTIVRTASAAGADGVILLGPSADPYDPMAVKASMGALFTVPVVAGVSPGRVPRVGGGGRRDGRRDRGEGERVVLASRSHGAAGAAARQRGQWPARGPACGCRRACGDPDDGHR